jgi:hypothetical protein
MPSPETPEIIQWIVDTRDLWPAATKTAQLEQEVSLVWSGAYHTNIHAHCLDAERTCEISIYP